MEIPGQSRRVPPGPPPNAPYSGSGVQGEPPMSPVMAPPPPPLLPQTAPNKQLPPVPPLLGAGSPPPPHPPPHGNNSLSDNKANKIEVMELSDLHHPSCKLNQSRQGSFDEDEDDDRFLKQTVPQS